MPRIRSAPRRISAPARALALLAAAVLAGVSCGGGAAGTCMPHAATRLPLATALHDTATTAATRAFSFAATVGARFSVALVGASDSTTSLLLYGDPCLETPLGGAPGGRSPLEMIVTATDSAVWFTLTPGAGTSLPANHVLLIDPVPSALNPVAETATLAAETPTVGQVATRSSSAYTAPNLVAGGTYTISLTAMTEDVVLQVFTDSTRSFQLACTQNAVHTLYAPQECTTTLAGTTAYFSVASGSLDRVGARYVVLVSRR